MSKFKFNLYCNDTLEPSSSDKNTPKYVEWDYHGNGDVNLYVSQRALDAINDRSGKPTYIWLLESRQIIPQFYDWVLNNYDFVMSRVDGIFSCDESVCEKYEGVSYGITNAAPWVVDRQIYKKTKWDIKTNSQELYHSLKYEYGFNTLNVNGKFEVNSFKSYKNFVYFFYFQDLIKQNITFKNPFNLFCFRFDQK